MSPVDFEKILIKYLYQDVDVRDKTLPFLTPTIFDDFENKEIVKFIQTFDDKYGKFPTIPDTKLHLQDKEVFNRLMEITNLDVSEYNNDSLLNEIEDFFKKKLIWNAITDSADNLKEDNLEKMSEMPDKLRTAVAFSFNTEIGLDLLNDGDRLFEFFHNRDRGVPTGLKSLDKWISGGVHKKTLTIFMGETNLGKTLMKCAIAANMLLQNKSVLYVTLEMSEENIAGRILQNMFDLEQEEMKCLSKAKFMQRYNILKEKLNQNLFIKEYPTKGANANTFRNLLKELWIKKKFKPDVMFIDYLGICLPQFQLKSDNTYTEGKRISEEIRGLAVEEDIPIVSSVQSNRNGFGSSELSLKDIADSIGTAQGADIIIGAAQSDEFAANNKISLIILKNRYGLNKIKLVANIDKGKMRIWDDDEDYTPTAKPISQSSVSTAAAMVKTSLKKDKDETIKKIIDFE